jgi:hypothetical protein
MSRNVHNWWDEYQETKKDLQALQLRHSEITDKWNREPSSEDIVMTQAHQLEMAKVEGKIKVVSMFAPSVVHLVSAVVGAGIAALCMWGGI